MARLRWFHAFRRSTPAEYARALATSIAPPPASIPTKTAENEEHLGIRPRHVYFYAGRTTEAFGLCVAVFDAVFEEGFASPFDSGGLVEHIDPVSSWSQGRKRSFLKDYTWSKSDAADQRTLYPGNTVEAIERYLDPNASPAQDGPHAVWTERTRAEIWRRTHDPEAWKRWTWELRCPGPVEDRSSLVAWAAASTIADDILTDLETIADSSLRTRLFAAYRDGGVSSLISDQRREQVTL